MLMFVIPAPAIQEVCYAPLQIQVILVQDVLERLARAEFDHLTGGDGQSFAGAGITPLTRLAAFHSKGTEATQGNFAVPDQALFQ